MPNAYHCPLPWTLITRAAAAVHHNQVPIIPIDQPITMVGVNFQVPPLPVLQVTTTSFRKDMSFKIQYLSASYKDGGNEQQLD